MMVHLVEDTRVCAVAGPCGHSGVHIFQGVLLNLMMIMNCYIALAG